MKKSILLSFGLLSLVGVVWLFAQPAPPDPLRRGIPDWELSKEMPHDVFTFVRIEYESAHGSFGRRGGPWKTDYPDADLNFSYRLQELTSMKVHPKGKILKLTDPELFDYPFIYIIEPGIQGGMILNDKESENLRKYLLNGGFLLVDDFWGDEEYDNFVRAMEEVFPPKKYPRQQPRELPLEHPIFHCVFDLKEKPQLPSIGGRGGNQPWRFGINYERGKPYDKYGHEARFNAIMDDKDRMMVFICHNTDLGDGWEREGEDPEYFKKFSEPRAYPMGINIIYYAMTH